MTYPSPSGSRTAAPLPPSAPPLVPTAPATSVPRRNRAGRPGPGEPGFIGATTHERPDRTARRRRAPLAWLPWTLLAALLGVVLLTALAASLVGRDTKSSASPVRAATSPSFGSLTADGTDLLAGDGSLSRLGNLNGTAVSGRAVLVQSVVADEGFWVGRSATDRAFVYLTPQARRTGGESPFQVRAGMHVDLAGTVALVGRDGASRLGVTDAEGARQLAAQRGYVLARSVQLSS